MIARTNQTILQMMIPLMKTDYNKTICNFLYVDRYIHSMYTLMMMDGSTCVLRYCTCCSNYGVWGPHSNIDGDREMGLGPVHNLCVVVVGADWIFGHRKEMPLF